MIVFKARFWWIPLGCGIATTAWSAPVPVVKAPPPPPVKVEPGMETAIRWKWWVVPSDEKDWGIKPPQPVAESAPVPGASAKTPNTPGNGEPRPATYEVQKGDALIKIAKKFDLTAAQIKTFNGKKDDVIRIGEVLKIPTIEDLKAMTPVPVAVPVPPQLPQEKKIPKGAKAAKSTPKQIARIEQSPEYKTTLMQAFLDRQNFSTGSIDGRDGAMFLKMVLLYQMSHGGLTMDALLEKVHATLTSPYTQYILSEEDFHFILPPKLQPAASAVKGSKGKPVKSAPPPPLTYEELVAEPMLAYRTPWEFVAERFHCDEAYLRRLNFELKGNPGPGAEFKVPNVIPFEIEKAFTGKLQAAANPKITAAVVAVTGVTRLEISNGGELIAAMPLTMARPDLRGRGTWTILDAVPRPRLATRQEIKEQTKIAKAPSTTVPGQSPQPTPPPAEAEPPPPVKPPLDQEQYLAPGPNNPVGIVWINLAKGNSTQPLPYGLHGTSIPDRMGSQESLGGLRMANWDIIRAVRLIPAGTPLQWK